jgi:hypothetical protein
MMKLYTTVILILISISSQSLAAECDGFVAWVAPAKDAYFKKHRIYPIPDHIQVLAKQHMPQLWVHPESWQPIDFEDYLAKSKLTRKADHKVLKNSPSARYLATLDQEEQCSLYLDADEIIPNNPAPVYIQAFWDQNPADLDEKWIFIKYNLVFDWSGLAEEISWLSRLGAWLSGGGQDRWHRLDLHLAAILAFDSQNRLRLLTLAQHNHQHTFLPDVDFRGDRRLQLVAAFRSNELYLDDGSRAPRRHRVVPFFSDVAYLINPKEKPRFWAIDVAYGRNAGGKEVSLKPVFIEPKHPLADFAGLLGPPRRLLGQYIGRDGPPGFNFYAPPAYVSMTNFAAMGYWREGDLELLAKLNKLVQDKDDFRATDWNAVVTLMRDRLAQTILNKVVEKN